MAIEIKKKIIAYDVLDDNKPVQDKPEEKKFGDQASDTASAEIIQMHEKLERPEMLLGSTYKIKTPQSEHALYPMKFS